MMGRKQGGKAAMTMSSLEPTARRGDQVFEALRAAILSGRLEPGTRLRIRDLAEQLGTSVMPVRDAITRLEEARLVESAPYRGAVVRAFSAVEMLNVYDVRRLLEVEAARQGAQKADDSVMERMAARKACADEAIGAGDQAAFLDEDEAFLRELYSAGENPVLMETISALWRRSRLFKLFGVRGEWAENPSMLLDYQESLLDALRARDAGRAGEILSSSIERAANGIRDQLVS